MSFFPDPDKWVKPLLPRPGCPPRYLWEWAQIRDPGHRFENMVAGHLIKAIDAWNDLGLDRFSLHYWRDLEKREVDFLVANEGTPVVAIECKTSDTSPTPSCFILPRGLGFPEFSWWKNRGLPGYYPEAKRLLIYGGTETKRLSGIQIIPAPMFFVGPQNF